MPSLRDLYRLGRRRLVAQSISLLALTNTGSLPDFLIVGAQKGGTTSLYRYLELHPQILSARGKEPQFFTLNYARGLRWYKAWFPSEGARARRSRQTGLSVLTGEATPYYLAHPDVPQRIAETLPGVKMIALLRNPVDRCISHYYHNVRMGWEKLPLAEALQREKDMLAKGSDAGAPVSAYSDPAFRMYSYASRGRYVEQLDLYAKYIPRTQMLVLKSELLFGTPQAAYDRVLEFLGLIPQRLDTTRTFNEGSYRKQKNPEIREQLKGYFDPYNKRLYEYLGEDLGWQ